VFDNKGKWQDPQIMAGSTYPQEHCDPGFEKKRMIPGSHMKGALLWWMGVYPFTAGKCFTPNSSRVTEFDCLDPQAIDDIV